MDLPNTKGKIIIFLLSLAIILLSILFVLYFFPQQVKIDTIIRELHPECGNISSWDATCTGGRTGNCELHITYNADNVGCDFNIY